MRWQQARSPAMDNEEKFEQFLSSAVEKVEQDRALSMLHSHGADTPSVRTARVSDIVGEAVNAEVGQSMHSEARSVRWAPDVSGIPSIPNGSVAESQRRAELQSKHFEDQIDELETEITKLNGERLGWEEDRAKLVAEAATAQSMIKDLRDEMEDERREKRRSTTDARDLDDQLRINIAKHEAMKKRWKIEIERMEETSSRMNADFTAKLSHADSELKAANVTIESLQEKLNAALAQAKKQREGDAALISHTKHDLAVSQKHLQNAEQLLAQSERKRLVTVGELETSNSELERMHQLKAHCLELEHSLHDTEHNVALKQEKLAVIVAERAAEQEASKLAISRLEAVVESLRHELGEAKEEIHEENKARLDATQEAGSTKVELEAARNDAERYRVRGENLQKDHAKSLESLAGKLKEQQQVRDAQLAKLREEHAAELEQAEAMTQQRE